MVAPQSDQLSKLIEQQRYRLIMAAVLMIFATMLGLVPFVLIYLMVLEFMAPEVQPAYVWELAIASVAAIVARWVLTGVAIRVSHVAAYCVLYEIRAAIAQKLSTLPLGFFSSRTTGTLKKIMNEDVEQLELLIAHGFPETTGAVVTIVLAAAYLIYVDWRMAAAALLGIPLALLCQVFIFQVSQPLLKDYYQAMAQMNAALIEYVQGMQVIKAFTQTAESFTQYRVAVESYHTYEERWSLSILLPWTLFNISLSANILFILPVGVGLLISKNLTVSTLALFLLLGLGICAPLFRLAQSAQTFAQVQEARDRINSLLQAASLPEQTRFSPPQDMKLKFDHVYFSYDTKTTLSDISFVVPKGGFTALVGPSGSGKTTIARLIARFWDIDRGEISIGGVNIQSLPLEELMSLISFVFQDVILFNDTVYENIRIGKPNASEEEVMKAARLANCHPFVEQLPHGYQTTVGERGAKLSGGQQQRLSIARALLKNAPILILDEATAFLDPENESQVQAAINRLTRDKTLIVIAHRLSTVIQADQILVLENGTIAARGVHGDLLSTSHLYRQMWQSHMAAQGWSF